MKKRNVLWFFGSITLLSAGYAAWCTHWMWMDAPMPELLEIPAEYRESAQELVVEHGLTRRAPIPFSRRQLVESLGRPYEAAKRRDRVQVFVPWKDGSKVVVIGYHGSTRKGDAVLTFRRARSGWSMLAEEANGKMSSEWLEKR